MAKDAQKLLQMAAEYEEKARAFRVAAAALNGHATQQAQASIEDKLRSASRQRGEKVSGFASMSRNELKTAREEAIRVFMGSSKEGFHMKEITAHLQGLGFPEQDGNTIRNSLFAIGAKNNGKPMHDSRWFVSHTNHATPKGIKKKKQSKSYWDPDVQRKRRQQTKALLDKAEKADGPVPASMFGGRGVGVLVANGYLKKQGDGFVRTDKEFSVETK